MIKIKLKVADTEVEYEGAKFPDCELLTRFGSPKEISQRRTERKFVPAGDRVGTRAPNAKQ